MKCHHIRIIEFVLVASVLLQVAKSEFFTAIAELEKLLYTEAEIVKGLERYLEVEEERLGKVRRLSNQYSMLHNVANTDVETFLSNPVNAYLLVKRLTADWDTTNQLIRDHDSGAILNATSYQTLLFPNEEDLKGAAAALLRLQEIYLLDTATIASGRIKGTTLSSELTAGDCFELGRQAYQASEYNHTIRWMKESWSRLQNEDLKTANATDIIDYMAYSAYLVKNYTYALELTELLIRLDPYLVRAYENRVYFQGMIAEEEEKRRAKGDLGESDIPIEIDWGAEGLSPKIVDAYGRLCRGESLKTPEEEAKLHCYYTSNNNSYLLLQPVKVEVLNLEPRLVVYHDVLKEWEADVIRAIATPMLERATVSNATSGEVEFASYRISKSAWLSEYQAPLVKGINRRVEDITGLDSETAEDLHVINYGIGGHYEPHFDYAMPGDKISFLETGRNRIATWIFYLSHVPAGGSTVFPEIGVEVKPIKGSAVFWHNLFRNGDGDERTRHAACPVLAGSKWVANKWIHELGNEFKRKCSLDPFE